MIVQQFRQNATPVIPELEHHATAIGYVCFAWGDLEVTVDLFIEMALGCSEDAARAINTAAGQFIRRCKLLREIVSESPQSNEWLESIEELYSETVDRLAADRNRLIHDAWTARPTPRQTDYTVRLRKLEAGAAKTILPIKETARTVEWIWQLEGRIKRATARWNLAMEEYLLWSESRQPPAHPTQ